MFCLLIEIAITSGPCGLAVSLPFASVSFRPFCDGPCECWRTFRCRGGATISGAGCENPGSGSGQKTVACACEATPIAPAAVKAAILHHEFEKEREIERVARLEE